MQNLCTIFLWLVLFQFSSALEAQNTVENTVEEVVAANDSQLINACVDLVFEGMLMADSSMVSSAFTKDALLQTVYETEADKSPRSGSLPQFLHMVSQAKEGFWIEKTVSRKILVNESLAHVWMEYEFYLGDQFLHCGVNSFQLVKIEGKWKIIYLCDNRQEKCAFQGTDK